MSDYQVIKLSNGENLICTVVFDLADNLSHTAWTNFTFNHFQERINIYNEEEFNYQIDKVKL